MRWNSVPVHSYKMYSLAVSVFPTCLCLEKHNKFPNTVKLFGRGGRDRFVRDDELECDDRSPLVSRSNPVAAAFAFGFANLRKKFRRAQNHTKEW